MQSSTTRVSLRALLLAVSLAAIAAIVVLPEGALRERPETALALVTMAVMAGFLPVRFPSLRVDVTVTHPFVLCALAALGPLAAVLADLGGVLAAALGRGRRPPLRHLVFNLGAAILSTAAAWTAFVASGGRTGAELAAVLLPVVVATAVYFLVQAALVSLAVALEARRPVVAVLRQSCLWNALPFAAGLSLAVAMLGLIDLLVPWGALVALPFCLLLVSFYRGRAARVGLAAKRG